MTVAACCWCGNEIRFYLKTDAVGLPYHPDCYTSYLIDLEYRIAQTGLS